MAFLKAYRAVISPLYGPVCRFYPSCSAYALRSVEFHGAIRGSYLTIRRLVRCHPWNDGGFDYVPGTPEAQQYAREEDAKARLARQTTACSCADHDQPQSPASGRTISPTIRPVSADQGTL